MRAAGLGVRARLVLGWSRPSSAAEQNPMVLIDARRLGFALTEALAVLVVVALFAVVAVPVTLEVVRNHRRDGAARRVLADIRLAQSMAATRGRVHAWQWGPDAGRSERESRIVRANSSRSPRSR